MKDTLGYGVCHDGDGTGNFHYLAGAEVVGAAPPPKGFTAMSVPAATYAVYAQKGLAWTIPAARWRIHQELLPEGYVLADAPEIEFYPANYKPNTLAATMEVWIPVVVE
jgi:AraC family transcriptional regulator